MSKQDRAAVLADVWNRHVAAEFEHRDAAASVATTSSPRGPTTSP